MDYPINDFSTYACLRQVLAPGIAVAPAGVIRARMEAEFGEGAADAYNADMESLFDDIGRGLSSAFRDVGRVAAQAAPVVATIGGGALQGAMSGSSLGLPGIIAGAAAGGAGAGLSHYGSGAARNIGGALTGLTGLAGQFSPMGRVGGMIGPAISGLAGSGGGGGPMGAASGLLNGLLGAAAGGGATNGALGSLAGGLGGGAGQAIGGLLQSPAAAQAIGGLFGGGSAAGQMASFLQRPETRQAFAALQLGKLGRPTIPVGSQQTPVPTAAFSQLLSHLADQVSTEAAGWSGEGETALEYMQDAEGNYVADPAFDRDRSARVWNLLNEAQAERVVGAMAPAPRAAPAPSRPRRSADAEAYATFDAEGDADAEWQDTLDMLDGQPDLSDWSDETEYSDG